MSQLKRLILYLQVILRVPVRVKYDTSVSSSQVDAQTTGSGTQQEDKTIRVRLAEAIDGGLSQVPTHSAVNSFIKVSVPTRTTS